MKKTRSIKSIKRQQKIKYGVLSLAILIATGLICGRVFFSEAKDSESPEAEIAAEVDEKEQETIDDLSTSTAKIEETEITRVGQTEEEQKKESLQEEYDSLSSTEYTFTFAELVENCPFYQKYRDRYFISGELSQRSIANYTEMLFAYRDEHPGFPKDNTDTRWYSYVEVDGHYICYDLSKILYAGFNGNGIPMETRVEEVYIDAYQGLATKYHYFYDPYQSFTLTVDYPANAYSDRGVDGSEITGYENTLFGTV